ncbi:MULTISPECIES: FUSC family protein [unclassified Xanthobacter]|uniref:FUSC family protein n=1 Tax=unclassified Xanthobacter TaxID=2623496 RepID=UPI001EDFC8A6|nr:MULTISPECIES: FUSC family protein [unclassified Xanthobacter]
MDAERAATAAEDKSRGFSHPGSWLRELARSKPAPWLWGKAIRAAFCIGLPFSLGYAFDATTTGMWVSLSALMMTAGEPVGGYRFSARFLVLSGVIGALGFLAGYLTVLPWGAVVAAMAVLGVVAGLLSSYGAVWSIGVMQALLLASIAIGVPDIGPYWRLSLLYLVGVVFYVAALGVQALVARERPQHQATTAALRALAQLAAALAGEREDASRVEAARTQVTDAYRGLTTVMMEVQSGNVGRSSAADHLAVLVQRCDAVFAALMATADRTTLLRARDVLLAGAAGDDGARRSGGDRLIAAAEDLVEAVVGRADGGPVAPPSGAPARHDWSGWLGRLAPGADAVRAALALGLCMGLAYAAHWLDRENHWFWIPLTVALVMKPDLGSIFARAVLRTVGTMGGAALGVAALLLVPKGQGIVLVLALFAAVLPWAKRYSYVVQAVALTPLVLLLVDIIEPGPRNVDYAVQRVVDTAIGGLIVLVFGYFLWPRTQSRHLAKTFQGAKSALADYLRAACALKPAASAASLAAYRWQAYGQLADMRGHLRTAAMEPPPASTEAAAWFPLIAVAERICDHVTTYAGGGWPALPPDDAAALEALAVYVAATPAERAGLPLPPRPTSPAAAVLADAIGEELAHMARLQEDNGEVLARAFRLVDQSH